LFEVWDIQTAEMLEKAGILVKGKNLPLINGGKPAAVVLNSTPDLEAYIQELGARADKCKGKRPEKGGDNILVILSDGIKASTDMRMIDPSMPVNSGTKIEYGITNIFEIWNRTKENKATQLVFIDKPAPDENAPFNPQVYMASELIKRGIPKAQIAFIHDYDSMDEKDDLFQAVNEGSIRVLFGSTEKMGAGTNVQERLVALHHITTPFRPRDIEQREGRIVRPGNSNKEVYIFRYVTKRSLDSFMWQMLEAKLIPIKQIMSGNKKIRVIDEEVDEYAAIKAASSDNPLMKEKVEVDKETRRLKNLKNAFLEQKFKAQETLKTVPVSIKKIESDIANIKKDIADRPAKAEKDTFSIEVAGTTYKDKATAHKAITEIVGKVTYEQYGKDYVPLGKYQSFTLFVHVLAPTAVAARVVTIVAKHHAGMYEAFYSESDLGTFASIDSAIYTQPDNRLVNSQNNLVNEKKRETVARDMSGKTFEHEEKLDKYIKRQIEIEREIKTEAEGKKADDEQPPDTIIEMHAGIPIFPSHRAPIVNDKIETGEVHFTNADTEARFKAAHGQHPDTLRHRIMVWFEDMGHRALRVYPDLPNKAEFAPIKAILNKQDNARAISQDQAIRNIDDITTGMGPNKLYLFTQAIVLVDLVKEAAEGRPIPFGYSSYDEGGTLFTDVDRLNIDKTNVDNRVRLNPDVAAAIDKRRNMWKSITDQLVQYKILDKDQVKEDYFRHQILDYANNRATFGTGKKLKTPSPGYAKRRFGSAELDINTNYLEAEFEVMAQALSDIQTAINIDAIRNNPLNIKDRLGDEARIHNEALKDRIVLEGVTNKDGGPVTVRDWLKKYDNKMGFGFSTLEKAGYAFNKDDETVYPQIAALAGTNDDTIDDRVKIAARMILKATSQKREDTKKFLGKNYKTWEDMIPAGYVTWQPRDGRVFYSAMTVSQRIINQVLDGIEVDGITKDDLHKLTAIGGMREQFVLPEEVATTLDNLYTAHPDNVVATGAKFLTTQWKKWVLFNPRRVTKYNFQNFLGDTDAVIAGQPKVFAQFHRAMVELTDVFYKGKSMSAEMREFFERGGMKTEMTIQEIPEINTLELFDRFKSEANKAFSLKQAFGSLHKYWNTVVEFTVYRETILRYAAYLYYRGVFQSGKVEYGASLRHEVDGLKDPLDKAARVATDLLGDYANITALGKDIRAGLIPFYSWYEINFKRYKRLTQNAWEEGFGAAGGGAAGAAAGGAAAAGKVAVIGSGIMLRFIIKAVLMSLMAALWNNLMFADEESELSPYDQNRMHITLGRRKDGRPMILRGQAAFADLMEWVGLDQLPALWRDYHDGKASLADIFGHVGNVVTWGLNPASGKVGAHQVFLKFMRGVNPLYKLSAETVTGKTVFGIDEQSGTIEDKWRNIARTVQMENEYDFITKKPSRGYFKSLWEAFITTSDPAENAFRYIQSQKHAYMETIGRGGSGAYYSPRSIVFRQYRKALLFKDVPAQQTALRELQKMGATVEDLQRSVATQDPLFGLNAENKVRFVTKYLSARDRMLLRRAYIYYVNTFLKPIPK
jgi:hypothetical protein